MKTKTVQKYDFSVSPAPAGEQKELKDSQKGLRTLSQIRDCRSYYQLYGACMDAKKKVFNHLDSDFRRIHELGDKTRSRQVYDDDIRMLFQPKSRFIELREKMAFWQNIKAPEDVEKLPAHIEIRRVIRILLMRNKNGKERSVIRFNPSLCGIEVANNAEIFLASLGYYVFDMLKREDLVLVYKDKLLELFKKELCHLTAIGYSKFVKETKEMYPESFYTDGKIHFKCFDENMSRMEKINAAKQERREKRMKIVKDFFKKIINPNIISQYFKKTGGNKPKLRKDLNELLVKEGYSPVSEKTVNRFKSEILKKKLHQDKRAIKSRQIPL